MNLDKHRTRIRRIIPFGIIWSVFGIVYSLVVKGVLGDSISYPATGIPYDFRSSLVITTCASLLMGLVVGTIEVYALHRWFRRWTFPVQIAMKTLFYTAGIVCFLVCINTVYLSATLDLPLYHREIIDKNLASFGASWFWSIVVFIGSIATMNLLFAEFQQHMGHAVIGNFFTGRYHVPRQEERIFMFLDMKSSTTLAERMGHVEYFGMLNRYYADLTVAITASSGEIWQYVGDEVVITWPLERGLRKNACLTCFFLMKDHIRARSAMYQRDFRHVPEFKGGLHCGQVTTGEIGTVRKDIMFTGDVMNTTARIQGLCNESGVDLLISEALLSKLRLPDSYQVREIGVRELKGKEERVRLFTVSQTGTSI